MVNEIEGGLKELQGFGIPVTPLKGKSVCVPSVETLKRLRSLVMRRPNIELMEDVLITRLLKSDGALSGATALDLATGEFFVVKTGSIVIATGGLTGELYPHTSNNPFGVMTDASGSGHVMAYHAGAELIDIEMIQFVPLPANPRCLHLRYLPDFWVGPYRNRYGEVIESNVASYPGESYSYLSFRSFSKSWRKGMIRSLWTIEASKNPIAHC